MDRGWKRSLLAALVAVLPTASTAQEPADEAAVPASPARTQKFRLEVEVKASARHSSAEAFRLAVPFPPEMIPAGDDAVYLRTVDAGSSLEVPVVALRAEGRLTPHVRARAVVHLVDLHNRNPTSSDDEVGLREAWVLFGSRAETLEETEGNTVYLRLGKGPRFSKQVVRRLESYGLWGTAVGRFEEVGLEVGGSFGRHLYWRGSLANGNPLFFRDTNALAGDHGTPELVPPSPDPIYDPGFPILYDAKAQDVNLDGRFQVGGGVGVRLPGERASLDVLAWGFKRRLEDAARIHGTSYEGDLDLLRGGGVALPFEGDDKTEVGVNVLGRWGALHLYGQYVSQDVAGLERRGLEAEAAYRFSLGGLFASGDEPVLNWLEPTVRYSSIDNDFVAPPGFVAPSMAWDWRKVDVGVRVGILSGVDLTAEYSFHDVTLKAGKLHPNEGLVTLRVAF